MYFRLPLPSIHVTVSVLIPDREATNVLHEGNISRLGHNRQTERGDAAAPPHRIPIPSRRGGVQGLFRTAKRL